MPGRSREILKHAAIVWFCLAALAFSWLLMQIVHEFGHVFHAWFSGGTVQRVVLHPLAISRTDVFPNPRPRIVTWGGFAGGIGIPLAMWWIAYRFRRKITGYFEFFTGFCLIANGAYLSSGGWSPVGDTRDLINRGESPLLMAVLGMIAIAYGLWIWHRLDRRTRDRGLFSGGVRTGDVVGVSVGLSVVVLLEWILSSSP